MHLRSTTSLTTQAHRQSCDCPVTTSYSSFTLPCLTFGMHFGPQASLVTRVITSVLRYYPLPPYRAPSYRYPSINVQTVEPQLIRIFSRPFCQLTNLYSISISIYLVLVRRLSVSSGRISRLLPHPSNSVVVVDISHPDYHFPTVQ